MSSNSIRVSATLFQVAQERGEALTRSAAQQVEHWARLGRAVEESGLSTDELLAVLRGDVSWEPKEASGMTTEIVSEQQLWADKRARQAQDIADVNAGRVSAMSMGWFSEERVSQAQVLDSPY